MATYKVQLDGLLNTTGGTQGTLNWLLFDKLHQFLSGSPELGITLIDNASGWTWVPGSISADSAGLNSIESNFAPTDRGCPGGASHSSRTSNSAYVYATGAGSNSLWSCFRFNSASIPFNVLVVCASGSRPIPAAVTHTYDYEAGKDTIVTRTNTAQLSNVLKYSVDCAPAGVDVNDYSINTATEVAIVSALSEGDFKALSDTGCYYAGTTSTTDNRFKGGALGIQIAQLASGDDPWALYGWQNLPTSLLYIPFRGGPTSDRLAVALPGSPWSMASSSYQWVTSGSTLALFPLSNSVFTSGTHNNSARNMFPLAADAGVAGNWNMRYSFIADKDNLLIITTDVTSSTTAFAYKFCYFGKYDSMKSVNPDYPYEMQVPYAFLATAFAQDTEPTIPHDASLVDSVFIRPAVWGSWKGNNLYEGGSWYPTASMGVGAVMLDVPGRSRDPVFNPNRLVDPPVYNRYEIGLWLTGSHTASHPGISYLGKFNSLVRCVSGLGTHDQTPDLKYAVVGNTHVSSLNSGLSPGGGTSYRTFLRQKMVIPWNGSTLIGTNATAEGLTGSITI